MKEEYEEAWDDVSGAKLDTEKVKAARAEEVKVIHDFNVYDKVPVAESWSEAGKAPIDTRWIDINRGDEEAENYRSRFVAKDFKWREVRDDTFAATPPLEALRYILSSAMTTSKRSTRTRARTFILRPYARFTSSSRQKTPRKACAAG